MQLKKLAAAQGLVTVGHKDGQQGKFPRRQAKLAAGAAHTVGAQVNGQVFVAMYGSYGAMIGTLLSDRVGVLSSIITINVSELLQNRKNP